MSRLQPIHYERTSGTVRKLLDGIQSEMGMIPNLFRTLAWSPTVLEGYCNSRTGLSKGVLPEKLHRLIGLTVAECNHSE